MSEQSQPHDAADFEPHRSFLRGLAYRMLGSRADAEDAVQDAWLRWHAAELGAVENPRAYLAQTVTRLCLDRLKSAQAQREIYVGQWLPEPLVDEAEAFAPSPEAAHELASDLSFAFMRALDRLSALERAAFLLHDVFDVDFAQVAQALGRSEAACRQLAARARANVRAERPRFAVTREDSERLAIAFAQAILQGDTEALARVLAHDATYISDGGGRATAVPRPLVGRELVAKVLIGFARHFVRDQIRGRLARVNGQSGFVFADGEGKVFQAMALELNAQGEVAAIYVQRNPDKLNSIAFAEVATPGIREDLGQ
jgi:RNA polymerase sigma-70 factor (ECF subfamily)